MRFCTECGHSLTEEAIFCPECGTKVENNETSSTPEEQKTTNTTPAKPPAPKKPMTKKQKLSIIAIAAVAVFLFALYQIGNSLTSIDRVLTNFEEAVHEGDAKQLADLLVASDARLEINEETVEPFLRYIDENPSYIGNIMDELRSQESYISTSEESDVEFGYGYGPIRLIKDGKTAFLFDRYKLEVKAEFIEFHSGFPGTVVSLNGEEVGTVTNDYFEYGPLMPGIHKVEAVYEGEYTDLTTEDTLVLMNSDYMMEYYIDFDEVYVDFYSNYNDAELFVNGESIGVTLNEIDMLGPLNRTQDVTFHIERDFPWGRVKSEEVKLEENETYYELNLDPVTEEVEEGLINAVSEYHEKTVEANKEFDANLYTNVTSMFKEWLQDDLDYYKDWEYEFVGKGVVSSEFDLDSIYLYFEDGAYHAQIVSRYVTVGDYVDMEYADEDDIDSAEKREEEETKMFYLIYDENEKKWLINDASYYYGFNEENTVKKEYK